jgi:predicted  nucleic acid-binding Zn-ribbon protein
MKELLALVTVGSLLVTGCNQHEEELQKQLAKVQGDKTALQQSIAERDKYFEDFIKAVNDVYADLETARVKEAELVTKSGGPEGPPEITNASTREKLLQNINDIGTSLKENRKKIGALQSRVKSFKGQIDGLNKLIDNLKLTLQEREESIAQLQGRVQGLETTVAENTKVIAEKTNIIEEQQKQMTKAFYIIGTRDDLKKRGIITDEGGFLWGLLGSTTVMASGINPSEFTTIDRTKDETINVNGKIDEILPHRNTDFFAMAEPMENASQLKIVRPDKFWQDNYLVIVLD